jgi:hypothetical protein
VLLVFTLLVQTWAKEPLEFLIVQPGQPGSPQEAQPVMDALANYLQGKLGSGVEVRGIYSNRLEEALDLLEKTTPSWGIVSLGFYAEHGERFHMKPLAASRPGGYQKDLWRLVVAKEGAEDWRALKGEVKGTMLFEKMAAACFLFGEMPNRLPFTLTGTHRPLSGLRKMLRGRSAGVVLDRLQYEALKALPLADNIKVLKASKELPTSPVVWFGPPTQWTEELASLLFKMQKDPEALNLVKLLQTEGFNPPDRNLSTFMPGKAHATCLP